MTAKLREASGETKRLADITRTSATAQLQKFWNKISDLGFKVIENTKFFEKLGRSIDGIDWESAANFVTGKLVPALNTVGHVIKNVIWPAINKTVTIVKTALAPVLYLAKKLFGEVGKSGEGLAEVLGVLGALWVAYRIKLVAAMAINAVGYFINLTKQISAAGIAQSTLNTKTVAGTASLKGAIGAVGKLNTAFIGLGAFAAGWTIGTILRQKLVDPLIESLHQARELQSIVKEGERGELGMYTTGALEKKKKKLEKGVVEEKEGLRDLSTMVPMMGAFGAMPQMKGKKLQEYEKTQQKIQDTINKKIMDRQRQNIERYSAPETGHIPMSGFDDFGVASVMRNQLKLDQKVATETRRFQDDMRRANMQKSAGGPVSATTKVEIGPTNNTFHITGSDPKEVGNIVDKKIRAHDRRIENAAKQLQRNTGAGEF